MGVAVKLNFDAGLFHGSPNIGTILQLTVCPNPVLACFASFLGQFLGGICQAGMSTHFEGVQECARLNGFSYATTVSSTPSR